MTGTVDGVVGVGRRSAASTPVGARSRATAHSGLGVRAPGRPRSVRTPALPIRANYNGNGSAGMPQGGVEEELPEPPPTSSRGFPLANASDSKPSDLRVRSALRAPATRPDLPSRRARPWVPDPRSALRAGDEDSCSATKAKENRVEGGRSPDRPLETRTKIIRARPGPDGRRKPADGPRA